MVGRPDLLTSTGSFQLFQQNCTQLSHFSHSAIGPADFYGIWHCSLGFLFFSVKIHLLDWPCYDSDTVSCVLILIQLTLFAFLLDAVISSLFSFSRTLPMKNVGLMQLRGYRRLCRSDTRKLPTEDCLPAESSRNEFRCFLAQVGPLRPPPVQGMSVEIRKQFLSLVPPHRLYDCLLRKANVAPWLPALQVLGPPC